MMAAIVTIEAIVAIVFTIKKGDYDQKEENVDYRRDP